MSIEDPIREAFSKLAEGITPSDRWERIAEGADRQPERPGPTPMSHRLLAGAVAVAVFVAAGLFAWQGFRRAPSATSSATPTASPTPETAATTYRDAAGWQIGVPQGWHAEPFTLISALPDQFVGVQLSDEELPSPVLAQGYPPDTYAGLQPSVTDLAASSVAVIVSRTTIPRRDEVPLPLSFDALRAEHAPKDTLPVRSANFAAAGSTFLVTVTMGSETPDAPTLRTVDTILASFRFPQKPTPTCLASQLTGREVDSEGAAGTGYGTIALENRSDAACHLDGWPGVALLGPTGAQLPIHERTDFPDGRSRQPSTVTLQPGGFAMLGVASIDIQEPGVPCRAVKAFQITPSDAGGTVDIGSLTGEICGDIIWVTPFTAFYDLQHPSATRPTTPP